MNRLMIDTNILVFYLREQDRLSRDVMALLTDYESRLYISMETLKELVTAYRRKNLFADRWKTASEMVSGITSDRKFLYYRKQGLDLIYNE